MTREEAISFLQRGIVGEIYDKKGYLTALGYEALEAIDNSKCPTLVPKKNGEWEALGFQQGYAFCRCSNCHKTMRLYRDSKNEFCCIEDIRKNVVSCMYCGSDNRKKED